jgi:AraC-like DNA-binding protein
MDILESNKRIHLTCSNYCKTRHAPLIEIRHLSGGSTEQLTTEKNGIAILLAGVVNFSSGAVSNRQINSEAIICFQAKSKYKLEILEDSTLIVFKLDKDLRFCANFSIEQLSKVEMEKKQMEIYILKTNSNIEGYLSQLIKFLNNEFCCDFLLELKLSEFLYLLRSYYPLQELRAFFTPILNEDYLFSVNVRKTYYPKITVSELASKMHYSISGFEKKFKKVFHMPPIEWLNMQLAIAICHELNCSTKTFLELSYEFGFSSPSHFHNFCKRTFQDTPGNIRKKNNMTRSNNPMKVVNN